MKYNKGFTPVLIALIVVGVLVIGGGAYYFGVNKNVEKEKENIKEDSIPSIEILSLKKIEQLVIGSKYTIEYKTNLAPKDGIVFLFVGTGEKNKWMKIVPSENNDSFSIASNSYIWTIPKEICGVEVCNSLVVGEKYKIKAVLTGTINNQFQDIASYVSDSYFTITSTSEESTLTKDVTNQPAYLNAAYTKNGKNYIDVDYLQMFTTSDERIKAMIEDGVCFNVKDCYDFPNGYKRNSNPLIRTFEVGNNISITIGGLLFSKKFDVAYSTNNNGSSYYKNGDYYNDYVENQKNHSSTFAEFKNLVSLVTSYLPYKTPFKKPITYIVIDVKSNIVTKIIESYQE